MIPFLMLAAVSANADFSGAKLKLSSPADSYPIRALRQGLQGTGRVAVTIDAKGKVVRCVAQSSIDSSIFDEGACNAVKYGHIIAAKDKDGTPVYGFLVSQMSFSIPDSIKKLAINPEYDLLLTVKTLPGKFKYLSTTVDVLIDQEGNKEACRTATSSGIAKIDRLACEYVVARPLVPATDSTNNTHRTVITQHVLFTAE